MLLRCVLLLLISSQALSAQTLSKQTGVIQEISGPTDSIPMCSAPTLSTQEISEQTPLAPKITPHFFPTQELSDSFSPLEEGTDNDTTTVIRGPENKAFNNVRVYNTLHTNDLYVAENTVIGGDLKVRGTIIGCGSMHGPSSSTTNAIARFSDTSGNSLIDSLVLISDTGNVTGVNTLTANTITAPILNGTATNVVSVGSQSAANVAAATVLTLSATSDNFYDSLVRRDSTGHFVTTMITLTGEVINLQDAVTKQYVDENAGTGIVTKSPALAMGTTNKAIAGLYTLDDVPLANGNRVLLVGQSNPIENGLWIARVGTWDRPADFFTDDTANDAYVLTTSGTLYAGSGWICTTPTAVIDNNPIDFVQFSSPGNVTGDNVGIGTGTIFKNKTGNILHFKTLLAGDHMIITNNLPDNNDITLTVSARSESIPNSLVMRDVFGNFSAHTITGALTGTASENILRSGDTMTGVLTLIDGSAATPSLQFAGNTNTGLSAATPNTLSFDTNGVERMSIDETGTIAITQFISNGIVHNDASGKLTSSLIVNADIAPNANIADTKLATINTPGKVLDSATTATSASIANTIVRRDSNGDFSANVITASSIIGATSGNVLKAGDTMTGTFTVIQGTAANPSLQFAGSNNTGLSAAIPNRLAFSTDGAERMSISQTGTITLQNTLVLAAGTAAQPSLQFANGTNTGLSSQKTGTVASLTFSTNGIERMCIAQTSTMFGLDQTTITVTNAAFVIGTVLCLPSTQAVTVISGDDITINNGVSTLVLSYNGNIEPLTIRLPNQPHSGQLITIKAIRLGVGDLGNNNSITYVPAFNPPSEAILKLSPNANLAGNAGGASVTYIYLTTTMGAPSDGWYRYGRG